MTHETILCPAGYLHDVRSSPQCHYSSHVTTHGSAVNTRAPDRLVITIALLFIASLFGMSKAFPIFVPKKHDLYLCRTPVVIPSHLNIICIRFVLENEIWTSDDIYVFKNTLIIYFDNLARENVVFLCPCSLVT